jgi:hypothetical protein
VFICVHLWPILRGILLPCGSQSEKILVAVGSVRPRDRRHLYAEFHVIRNFTFLKNPLALCLTLVLLFFVGFVAIKTAERSRKTAKMVHALAETTIETRDFQQPMSFGEMLDLLTEKCAAQGRDLPIWINAHAFDEHGDARELLKGSPEAAVEDTEIRMPRFPKKMRAATVLRLALSQIEPAATYRVCAEGVEILPSSKTDQASLRVYPVCESVIPVTRPKTWDEWLWEKLFRRPS